MEKEKYLLIQMSVIQMGRAARQLDLEGFIKQLEKSLELAPVLDPEMHKKAAENMEAIKLLAKTLLPVQDAFDKAFKVMVANAPTTKEQMNFIKNKLEELDPPQTSA